MEYPDYQPKVHMHCDQSAHRHGPKKTRRYADTLCKYNGKAKRITENPDEVTCKSCLKKIAAMKPENRPRPTRYRVLKRLFRKPVMVLQVRITEQRAAHCPAMGIEFYTVKYWRDVRPEELINGEVKC